MLALMLATLLHRGVSIWHEGEARREVYDEAQAVLGRIARDLECTFAESGPRPGGATGVVQTRFLSDYDALGRQRLRFVRTLAGEDADPLTRGSAEGTPADGWSEYRDGRSDPGRKLRALQGLAEVCYAQALEPNSTVLLRGERSPPGGAASLFAPEAIDSAASLAGKTLPVSSSVLLCRFLYWSQFTTTWDLAQPPGRELGEEGGPLRTWDSTRGLLPAPPKRGQKAPAGGDFHLAVGTESADDPVDDVWPPVVRVQVLVAGRGVTAMATELTEPLGGTKNDLQVKVVSTERFPDEIGAGFPRLLLRIGDEWVEYNRRDGGGFQLKERGLFRSRIESHEPGTLVRTGLTFVRSVSLPAGRGYWNK